MPLFAPYDVFISYKSEDREIAKRVQALLERHGLKVWRDERLADAAGLAYDLTINDALDASAKVLVLWSRRAIGSDWVRGEATKGRDQRKLVPLIIEPCRDLLPAPFNLAQDLTLDLAAVEADPAPLLRALGATADGIPGSPGAVITEPLADLDHLPATHTGRLFGRDGELRDMVRAWDGHDVHVLVFDAIGGTGKTALLHHFVHQQLVPARWRGCRAAFAYSFYSQGSTEDKQVDADEFFRRAFDLFGQTALGRKKKAEYEAEYQKAAALRETARKAEGEAAMERFPLPDPWPPTKPGQKGPALAELIQAQRSLLILDGLEPLQYVAGKGEAKDKQTESASGGNYGGIKDGDVKILLQRLARFNPGLCLVSTRVPLTELDESYGGFVQREKLQPLDAASGTALLRSLGVEPEIPEEEELTPRLQKEFADAVKELRGHALALNLVGRFVAEHREGRLKAIHDMPVLDQDEHIPDAHRSPFRVMRTIELHLLKTIQEAKKDPYDTTAARQLALLYFLGLFDRPAPVKLLEVVFGGGSPSSNGPHESHRPHEAHKAKPTRKSLRTAIRDLFHIPAPKLTPEAPHFADLSPAKLFATFQTGAASIEQIRYALGQLSRQSLVAKTDEKSAWERTEIDCHPLVREYFGQRLQNLDPDAFRAAHGRLYDHYRYAGLPAEFRDPVAYGVLALKVAYGLDHYPRLKAGFLDGSLSQGLREQTPPSIAHLKPKELQAAFGMVEGPLYENALSAFRPETTAQMEPLFGAITHGCLAERHDECFNEVYWPRIARGNEQFAVHKLGLHGQNLAALASFFADPFRIPHSTLRPSDQALVLNMAGYALRALGRLPDAVDPMREQAKQSEETEEWGRAATGYGNLSELLVTLGRLEGEEGALRAAADAVRYADRSGDPFQRLGDRTKEAAALLARGELARAEERFREAERLQKQHQPFLPRLYSLAGFLYGDLLLARGRGAEVAERSEYDLSGAQVLLDVGLAQLNAARASSILQPEAYSLAISSLHRANREDITPSGYLARAEAGLRRLEAGDFRPEVQKQIADYLTEAETIARRGPMPLFHAEAHLLAARTALVLGHPEVVRHHRDEAARLIREHLYGRREPDLAVLDAEINPTPQSFAAACQAVSAGWWHLIPRLEAIAGRMKEQADPTLLPALREAEAAYHAEREEYLSQQLAVGSRQQERPTDADALIAQLPAEIIQQIAQQTGAPADWHQWSEEFKMRVVKAIHEAQG